MPRRASISSRLISAFLLWAASLVLPLSSAALPQGGAGLTLLHRSTETESPFDSGTLLESLLRLDLYQNAPGYGRLFASGDLSRTELDPDGASIRFSRWQTGLEGLRTGDWSTSLVAGDTGIRFTNLVDGGPAPFYSLSAVKPPAVLLFAPEAGRFLNTTYPEITFRGGAAAVERESDSVQLFGGLLSNMRGFQANESQVTDQTLYGAKWAHQWQKGTYAGMGVVHTGGLVREGGLVGEKPLDNTVFLLDGSWRLNERVKLAGEFKENLFLENGRQVHDLAIKAGPIFTFARGFLEANYRRVGPDFLFVRENLLPERDVEGVFTAAEYRPLDNLTFYSSLDWNRTNLAKNPALSGVNSLAALVGGYFAPPGFPSLSLRFSFADRDSRRASSSLVANSSYSAYLESVYTHRWVIPYIRLQGDRLQDEAAPENSSDTGTVVAGMRIFPLKGFDLYLEGEEQLRTVENGSVTGSNRARGGFSLSPRTGLDIYGDAEYSHVREKPAGTTMENLTLSGRVLLSLPGRVLLSGDVRYGRGKTTGTTAIETSIFQVTVGLVKRFEWGERPVVAGGRPGKVDMLSQVGNIQGYVFLDLNLNGKKDEGEKGLDGVTIFLEDGSSATTDADGRYVFRNIASGIHQVQISERELSASLNLLTGANQRTTVPLRQTVSVNFPLLASGSLRGRVVADANGNGQADPDDTPVSDILVHLDGTPTNTFSDADGNFAIENLLPGSYLLKIDQTGLPAGMKLVSAEAIPLDIRSGEEAKDLVFLVGVEKKQVIRKRFGKDLPQK